MYNNNVQVNNYEIHGFGGNTVPSTLPQDNMAYDVGDREKKPSVTPYHGAIEYGPRVVAANPLTGMRIVDRDDLFPKSYSDGDLRRIYAGLTEDGRSNDLLNEEAPFEEVDAYYNPGVDVVPAKDVFEAIVIEKFSGAARRMNAVVRTFNRYLKDSQIKALPAIVGEPKKSGSFAYVTVQLPFSDGQTVSAIFHSPEGDKRRIAANDTLIAFRWLLNRRDITQILAPEGGEEISLESIGKRITQLVEKNSARFERTQKEAAAERKELEDTNAAVKEAEGREGELMDSIAAASKDAETVDARLANTLTLLEKQKTINAELRAKLDGLKKAHENRVPGDNMQGKNGSNDTQTGTEGGNTAVRYRGYSATEAKNALEEINSFGGNKKGNIERYVQLAKNVLLLEERETDSTGEVTYNCPYNDHFLKLNKRNDYSVNSFIEDVEYLLERIAASGKEKERVPSIQEWLDKIEAAPFPKNIGFAQEAAVDWLGWKIKSAEQGLPYQKTMTNDKGNIIEFTGRKYVDHVGAIKELLIAMSNNEEHSLFNEYLSNFPNIQQASIRSNLYKAARVGDKIVTGRKWVEDRISHGYMPKEEVEGYTLQKENESATFITKTKYQYAKWLYDKKQHQAEVLSGNKSSGQLSGTSWKINDKTLTVGKRVGFVTEEVIKELAGKYGKNSADKDCALAYAARCAKRDSVAYAVYAGNSYMNFAWRIEEPKKLSTMNMNSGKFEGWFVDKDGSIYEAEWKDPSLEKFEEEQNALSKKIQDIVDASGGVVSEDEVDEQMGTLNYWIDNYDFDELRKEKPSYEKIKEFASTDKRAIATVPAKYLKFFAGKTEDPRIYCSEAYFVNHAVNNHPEMKMEDFKKLQDVLLNADDVKIDREPDEHHPNGKDCLVFIKKFDKNFLEVISLDKTDDNGGQIVLHKTVFGTSKKNPYAKLPSIRDMSVDGTSPNGEAPTIGADGTKPSPGGSRISARDDSTVSTDGKDVNDNSDKIDPRFENLPGYMHSVKALADGITSGLTDDLSKVGDALDQAAEEAEKDGRFAEFEEMFNKAADTLTELLKKKQGAM